LLAFLRAQQQERLGSSHGHGHLRSAMRIPIPEFQMQDLC
jgi:hypothetical protein